MKRGTAGLRVQIIGFSIAYFTSKRWWWKRNVLRLYHRLLLVFETCGKTVALQHGPHRKAEPKSSAAERYGQTFAQIWKLRSIFRPVAAAE